jgi:hypothetical protein
MDWKYHAIGSLTSATVGKLQGARFSVLFCAPISDPPATSMFWSPLHTIPRGDSMTLLSMKEELETMFGRSVDLIEKRLVESSENYIRRRHILNHMETIYVA